MKQDKLAEDTRGQLREVFDAIRLLMQPVERQKRPIGFVRPDSD